MTIAKIINGKVDALLERPHNTKTRSWGVNPSNADLKEIIDNVYYLPVEFTEVTPTKTQVQIEDKFTILATKVKRIQQIRDKTTEELLEEIMNKRREEYPPVSEFLDAYVHMKNGDNTHMTTYVTTCNKVKTDNPKG